MDQANNLRNLLNFRKKEPISKSARVITVTSGKGGVGKTNFTVNLAIYLKRQNIRTVVVDADFGLANIEILLGSAPRNSLADLISGRYSIDEIITQAEGISFISGGTGLSDLANVSGTQLNNIVESMSALDSMADVILVDTGAGISDSVLKFVASANETIVVCAPEPTSITDAYSLVKAVKEGCSYIPRFRVVINQTEDKQEGDAIFSKLQSVAGKFLSLNLEHLGTIPRDSNLIKAVKSQKPCILSFPNSAYSKEIESIGRKILDLNVEKEPAGMKGFVRRLASIFGS